MSEFLSGQRLYGDDFSPEEIRRWHEDEREAYALLGAADQSTYRYAYHSWNRLHGFSALPEGRFSEVLGFGSAYGDELLPIATRIDRVTIVDSSSSFTSHRLPVPVRFVAPGCNGSLPLQDDSFDLATCFGVLHHIPNVTFVLGELGRVLKPGGMLLLREPVISMGDWRLPRRGLTLRERGIPLHLLQAALENAKFRVRRRALCGFSPLARLVSIWRTEPYNSASVARLDWMFASVFEWNQRYHATRMWHRFQPSSAYFVLDKVLDTSARSL